MKMEKERFLKTGLLEQYVLGLTDEEESDLVERYAEAHPDIQESIDKLRESVNHYALQYTLMPVSELRARTRNEVEPGPRLQSSRRPKPAANLAAQFSRFLLPASLLLFALAALAAVTFYQGKAASDYQYQRLATEFYALQESCAQQQAKQEQQQVLHAFLTDRNTTPVLLPGNELLPTASAMVFWNEARHLAYIAPNGLPVPQAGKTYQLWADVHGEMVSLGLIDARQQTLQEVTYTEEAESLNITIEPEGGSIEPTVALLIASNKL
jgi:anti-sigma-K factor RskA